MRSDVIVIASVGLQDAAQMCLAQDDKVIQTLAPDRTDQPFGKAILPRRRRRDRLVQVKVSGCPLTCLWRLRYNTTRAWPAKRRAAGYAAKAARVPAACMERYRMSMLFYQNVFRRQLA